MDGSKVGNVTKWNMESFWRMSTGTFVLVSVFVVVVVMVIQRETIGMPHIRR